MPQGSLISLQWASRHLIPTDQGEMTQPFRQLEHEESHPEGQSSTHASPAGPLLGTAATEPLSRKCCTSAKDGLHKALSCGSGESVEPRPQRKDQDLL